MSGGLSELKLSPEDAYKFLVSETHIGASVLDVKSEDYVFKRRNDGTYLINVGFTWEKLLLAARAIAAVPNPADVCVVSGRPQAQRALLKFAAHTGATAIVGRFFPGSFTNQVQKQFKEPRLIVVSDSRLDHQAVKEASFVNIPVIAFTNTDSPLKFVDIAIPSNNKGTQSVGLMWWMLAREVLRLRGKVEKVEEHTAESQKKDLDLTSFFTLNGKQIMPDLYFYRDPEDQKKEEEAAKKAKEEAEEKAKEEQDQQPIDVPIQVNEGEDGNDIKFDYGRVEDWAAQ